MLMCQVKLISKKDSGVKIHKICWLPLEDVKKARNKQFSLKEDDPNTLWTIEEEYEYRELYTINSNKDFKAGGL